MLFRLELETARERLCRLEIGAGGWQVCQPGPAAAGSG